MMNIKVIIVEDESKAGNVLNQSLKSYANATVQVMAICPSVNKAVAAIKTYRPDIVFLDIQLRQENGFDLLKHFVNPDFELIFTTAFQEYAIKAIKASAIDYLLKPIDIDDLFLALDRFVENKDRKLNYDKFRILAENISNQITGQQKLVFPSKNGMEILSDNEILFCKSDGAYSFIYTIYKDSYVSKSLGELQKMLSEQNFLRIHKSYLVNRNFIRSFSSEGLINLANGAELPVSENYYTKKSLMDAIST
ncbi:LytR/AlgR family response regulator transcription factor [Flavobacterium rakeshii]|nr:LytTR family DNA-binding domain-containing protein [Flavobacterium rakeshii]